MHNALSILIKYLIVINYRIYEERDVGCLIVKYL